ncbi:MAG: helix-turn-helix transcriptional regulator [Clostridia bacterium]|nr:helix-turn-helix transcriptional regulator [Clostridia bacterium]
MYRSLLLTPTVEDESSQPLYVEGVHAPDELARASGVWIAEAGSAMLPVGSYTLAETGRWLWFSLESGLVHIECAGVNFTLRGGDCCMLPPDTHGAQATASYEARVLWMTVDGPLGDGFMQHMGALQHRVMKQGALPSQLTLCRHIVQVVVRLSVAQDASSAQMQQLLWAMLASHSGQPVSMDAVLSHEIARVVDAMRKNQYRDSFSLAEMAAISRMPAETFRKRFVAEVGMPPQRYQLYCKMERAKTLLKQGCTVRQAGIEVGMNDPYHFSKTFKNIVGMSPSAYSKKAQN